MISFLGSLLRRRQAPSSGNLSLGESGKRAQAFAEKHLRKAGYKILKRNLSDKHGELDLIFKKPSEYAGVIVAEVRSFRPVHGKTYADVLPDSKKQQVMRAAKRILPKHKLWQPGERLRFDAIMVVLNRQGEPESMEHFKADFWPDQSAGF